MRSLPLTEDDRKAMLENNRDAFDRCAFRHVPLSRAKGHFICPPHAGEIEVERTQRKARSNECLRGNQTSSAGKGIAIT